MNAYGTGQYRQTQVTTVDKGRLIVLLYEGAIKFLREAVKAQSEGDIPAKASFINRTLDIIGELSQSLNMQDGGEIAQNLKSIYQFWTDHLLKAKISKDSRGMEEVTNMMISLIEAWQVVCADAEGAKVVAGQDNNTTAMTQARTI
ncbi:MAG: flagellar export chaperone FliS [Candidatus Adiutrix sp.]